MGSDLDSLANDPDTHLNQGNQPNPLFTLEPFIPRLPHQAGRGGRRRRGQLIPRTRGNCETEQSITQEFPKNFIIKSPENKNLSTINTIKAHAELINAINGEPKSIVETRKGTILIQISNKEQSEKILKIKDLSGVPSRCRT